MLALSNNSLLAHEPFNIQPWAYALDGSAKYWFTYAPALPQAVALEDTRSGNRVDAPKGTVHHIRRDSVANITRWTETLTEEEIARVYEITQPISSSYYQNKDLGIHAQPSIITRDAIRRP